MATSAIPLILLAALSLALLTAALVRAIRRDGLGQGTPPRSHHAWDAGSPWLPLR